MNRTPPHLALITPRFAPGATIGGAETLLKNLAAQAAQAGCRVSLLTTCASDHFTWANARPPGEEEWQGIHVRYFPVDEDRDIPLFLRVQDKICREVPVTDEEESLWMRHNVNSSALYAHLEKHAGQYDRIVLGPYLFSLIYRSACIAPEKTWLIPCLHDEAFARLRIMNNLFDRVAGLLFNTEPEQALAQRLFRVDPDKSAVVGMGLDPFDADAHAFARRHNLHAPYLCYAGRREPLKGTPLLIDYWTTYRRRTGQDIRLVFTGSGPIDVEPDMAPYVRDAGFVSEEEKRDIMAGALAFVHPSVNESLGIVLLEAWLAKVPALVHAAGDVLRWQCRQSRAGCWFRHYPDFEELLTRYSENPAVRQQLGEAGRRYVTTHYAWPAVMNRFMTALRITPPAPNTAGAATL